MLKHWIRSSSLAAIALAALLAASGAQAQDAAPSEPGAAGPYQPSWDSLKQYQTPEWFRDAKFGIWAHWTAQCVPEQGDWYARNMYIEGNKDYAYQVAHYGHPSKVGFKDIDNLWHAEHWEPEKLIDMYKKAGAKYFVALANHHDNFDCFDSKYQPWNSVAIGPHKDIVGTWEKAARAAGLRFGVTVHASHAWSWYEVAQGADKKGPLAGVPYDGKLTKEDGKGLWWEGLDPQDLYSQNHTPGTGKGVVWDWDASKGSSVPDKAYFEKFFNRTADLVNKYHPDLLYFDDTILPFYKVSDVGLRIAAHLYNSSLQWHNGQMETVLNGKGLDEEQRKCMVWDIERGVSDHPEPFVWQTDTCIGDWHYNITVLERHRYKTAKTVIHMLADIVSKNGNLLLNVPVKGDGTIDADEVQFLDGMAKWMNVNSECIFGTRPWKLYGETSVATAAPATPTTKAAAQTKNFNEGKQRPMGPTDFRFTSKGDTLYAIELGWPDDGKATIKSLAAGSENYPAEIGTVQMLGAPGNLKFTRTPDGLTVELPTEKPCEHAFAIKITPAGK